MKKLLLLFLVVALHGCTYEDINSGPILVFKYTVEPGFQNGYRNETWIIVRDNETGFLIGSKQLFGNEPVEFRAEKIAPGTKLAVSIAIMTETAFDDKACYATVYNGVAVGSEWTLGSRKGNYVYQKTNRVGKYTLNVTDVPPLYAFIQSNEYTSESLAYLTNTRLTGLFDVFDVPSKQLVVIDPDGYEKPKHTWLDSPNKGEVINLDYGNFRDFDNYLTIDFTKTRSVVAGLVANIDPVRSHMMYSSTYFKGRTDEIDKLDIGYLNDFSDYQFSIAVNDYNYQSRGPMPAKVTYSDFSGFKIEAKSLAEYSLTTTRDYIHSVAYFNKDSGTMSGINYGVLYHCPAGMVVHHDPLTPALIERWRFPIDRLKYRSTGIMLSGQSYEDMLKMEFDPSYEMPAVYHHEWLGSGMF